jgi:hypothetical protein
MGDLELPQMVVRDLPGWHDARHYSWRVRGAGRPERPASLIRDRTGHLGSYSDGRWRDAARTRE